MEKKTVFITGAASGIGRAAAQLFASKGFFVGACDVNEDALKSLKEELGENCMYAVCDVTSDADMKKALESFSKVTNGRLDVLVPNAGILVQKYFEEGTLNAYKRMMNVNSYGVVNTIFQALPMLKQSKPAKIVITSSASAVFGMPKFSVYSASKNFLRSLAESLSAELKKYKISVSTVVPLFVKTGMTKDQNEEQFKEKSTQTPRQIAKRIFKASNSKKRHHYVGFNVKMLSFLERILPTRVMEWFLSKYLGVEGKE